MNQLEERTTFITVVLPREFKPHSVPLVTVGNSHDSNMFSASVIKLKTGHGPRIISEHCVLTRRPLKIFLNFNFLLFGLTFEILPRGFPTKLCIQFLPSLCCVTP